MAAPNQPAPSPGPPHRVCLIDGSGFIFRAFHALPPLSRSDGTPINAVMGFCNMLMKLIDGTPSDSIACVFDYSGRSFRNDIYPAYKAHRPPPPEELVPQFPLIREAARAFALPTLELEGFEADDIVATLARIAREAGAEVTVVSSDKDLMQLVGAGVAMRDGLKDRDIREAEVVEKFGVTPDKVVDVQALAGDAVDNVPGAPGIGVKTAGRADRRTWRPGKRCCRRRPGRWARCWPRRARSWRRPRRPWQRRWPGQALRRTMCPGLPPSPPARMPG